METSKARSVINVALRLPSVFLLHMILKGRDTELTTMAVYFIILVMQLLDLKKLVKLYRILIGCALLAVSWKVAEWTMDSTSLVLFRSLFLQVLLSCCIPYFLDLRQDKMIFFLAYSLPILSCVFSFPEKVTSLLLAAANFYIVNLLLLLIVINWKQMYEWVNTDISNLLAVIGQGHIYGGLLTIWHRNKVGLQLLTFGIGYLASTFVEEKGDEYVPSELWFLTPLENPASCCDSVLGLASLAITISYACSAVFWIVTTFLHWRISKIERNEANDGTAEAFVCFIVAWQMNLQNIADVKFRAAGVYLILFHLASSFLRSLQEITGPVLLTAAASLTRGIWKHVRCIYMCLVCIILPLWMMYLVLSIFKIDPFILGCVCRFVMTAVQSFGSLVIYSLFMYDQWREEPWDSFDDAVYYTRTSLRVICIIISCSHLAFGIYGCFTLNVSYTTMLLLLFQSYFDVWLNIQQEWETFLRRRQAASRVDHLPMVNPEDLAARNDLCSICYQRMTSARVTQCGHCFHAACLRKWMYVQTFCPMCHAAVSLGPRSSPGPLPRVDRMIL